MIDPATLGMAPVGLFEKSRKVIESVIVALANGYMAYRLCDGRGQYVGTIDYSQICIQ
ncbi:hypothetical protein G3N58_17780 [Paraburkholderia sp. Ac-20342]|uniref:hypothetical protein n=1 Tax=Paraburkholderia sp. Ac-20342 TaxID=2703889 RepID=UPI00197DD456|nr:hypothetical protein [Paraburkholderia sp. Ac-20342]MBN3848659.1 hypothetical protein [Paraburkholderia sp. Ac-20342]